MCLIRKAVNSFIQKTLLLSQYNFSMSYSKKFSSNHPDTFPRQNVVAKTIVTRSLFSLLNEKLTITITDDQILIIATILACFSRNIPMKKNKK